MAKDDIDWEDKVATAFFTENRPVSFWGSATVPNWYTLPPQAAGSSVASGVMPFCDALSVYAEMKEQTYISL